ncbi:MAG: sulfatase-like hydrolase/transferase [Verrucomicrobiota bacterium]
MKIIKIKKQTYSKMLMFSFFATLSFQFSICARANDLPNVVLIVADDLGYADVSYTMDYAMSMRTSDYVDKPWSSKPLAEVHTPNIDRLARQAAVFTNGYVNANVCSPTRAGLMLGRYQQRVGIYSAGTGGTGMPLYESPEHSKSGVDFPKINPMMPEFLKQSADPSRHYVCGAFGKWHLGLDRVVRVRKDGSIKSKSGGVSSMDFDYVSIGNGYEEPDLKAPINDELAPVNTDQPFDPTWKGGSPWHCLNRGFDHYFYFMGRGAHDFWDPNGIYDSNDPKHPLRRTVGLDKRLNPGASGTANDAQIPDEAWESSGAPYRIHKERVPENYLTVRITDAVCDFIKQQAASPQPFLAYVPYNAPHSPLQTPHHMDPVTGILDPLGVNDRRYHVVDEAGAPVTPVTDKVFADWLDPKTPDPKWFPDPLYYYETYKDDPDAFRFFYGVEVTKKYEEVIRRRCRTVAMNQWIDKGIGQIVEKLKDPNGDGDYSDSVYDNTIILFLSDNGGATVGGASNAPLSMGKHSNFEGGLRVPFFISWPAMLKKQYGTAVNDIGETVAKQQLIHAPVMAFDILPTLLEITGEKPLKPDPLLNAEAQAFYDYTPDGKSLLPLIRGEVDSIHDYLFWAQEKDSITTGAVRRDQWKLVFSKKGSISLYNLDEDIAELQDRSADHPEIVKDLKKAYIDFMNSAAESYRQPVPNKLMPKSLQAASQ